MNSPFGFLILIFLLLVGNIIAEVSALPVPGSIIGMLILLGFLHWRRSIPEAVGQVSDGLIRYLGLLFVPAGAGVSAYWGLIADQWAMIIFASFGSTVLTLVFCALLYKRLSDAEK